MPEGRHKVGGAQAVTFSGTERPSPRSQKGLDGMEQEGMGLGRDAKRWDAGIVVAMSHTTAVG